jgi:hypothetical protein
MTEHGTEAVRMASLSDPGAQERAAALEELRACERVIARIRGRLRDGAVPTGRFREALGWARRQLERAARVQRRPHAG